MAGFGLQIYELARQFAVPRGAHEDHADGLQDRNRNARVAAISDLEVIRIAWEETHTDRPRWQKLPEEAFWNRYPRSDPGSGQKLPLSSAQEPQDA